MLDALWRTTSRLPPATGRSCRRAGGLTDLEDIPMTAELKVHQADGIGWITFSNLERHNAVTYEMWQGVTQAVADFDADPAVCAIVLTGDGDKAVVSGADISEFEKKRGTPGLDNRRSTHAYAAARCRRWRIRGTCMGGGLYLARASGICNDRARFAMPAAKLGWACATKRSAVDEVPGCPRGRHRVHRRQFDGPEALRLGFVNRSVADEQLTKRRLVTCSGFRSAHR
jgi:enoyl-CoA hydratase/carnithine racemase